MKAQFSKNAWHHKLNMYVYGLKADFNHISLCPYFWITVLSCLLMPFRLLINGARRLNIGKDSWQKIGIICYSVFAISSLGIISYNLIIKYGVFDYLFWFGVIAGAVIFLTAIFLGFTKLVDWIDYNKESVLYVSKESKPKKVIVYKEKKPSLFWTMLKAKKEKVCPHIEWSDEQ